MLLVDFWNLYNDTVMSKTKKYILIGVGVIVLISILSNIGGSDNSNVTATEKKELVLKAAQTEVKGDLKGCFEVVDKNYKVKFAQRSYENDIITVELKRTSKELPYERDNVVIFPEGKESSADKCAGFGVEILNADGDVIDKINAKATPYSWDEMTAALQLLPDETSTIAFHFDNLSEAASFRVTSLVLKNDERKTEIDKKAGKLIDQVSDIVEMAESQDLEKAQEDAEKALQMAGETMKLAGKMLDAMGGF